MCSLLVSDWPLLWEERPKHYGQNSIFTISSSHAHSTWLKCAKQEQQQEKILTINELQTYLWSVARKSWMQHFTVRWWKHFVSWNNWYPALSLSSALSMTQIHKLSSKFTLSSKLYIVFLFVSRIVMEKDVSGTKSTCVETVLYSGKFVIDGSQCDYCHCYYLIIMTPKTRAIMTQMTWGGGVAFWSHILKIQNAFRVPHLQVAITPLHDIVQTSVDVILLHIGLSLEELPRGRMWSCCFSTQPDLLMSQAFSVWHSTVGLVSTRVLTQTISTSNLI